MSWFSIAKSALSQAQRSIDKVLDIEQENTDDSEGGKGQIPTASKSSQVWGVTIIILARQIFNGCES